MNTDQMNTDQMNTDQMNTDQMNQLKEFKQELGLLLIKSRNLYLEKSYREAALILLKEIDDLCQENKEIMNNEFVNEIIKHKNEIIEIIKI